MFGSGAVFVLLVFCRRLGFGGVKTLRCILHAPRCFGAVAAFVGAGADGLGFLQPSASAVADGISFGQQNFTVQT